MKQCTTCGQTKAFTDFSPHKLGVGGVRSTCKPCSVQKVLAYRKTSKGTETALKAARKHRSTPHGASYRAGWNRADYEKHPAKYLLIRARSRAKKKGVPFTITEKDVVIGDTCPALGVPIRAARKGFRSPGFGGEEDSMSLDRIEPALGYVPGNVAVISWRANRLKNDASLEELERLVAWLKNHKTSRGETST